MQIPDLGALNLQGKYTYFVQFIEGEVCLGELGFSLIVLELNQNIM